MEQNRKLNYSIFTAFTVNVTVRVSVCACWLATHLLFVFLNGEKTTDFSDLCNRSHVFICVVTFPWESRQEQPRRCVFIWVTIRLSTPQSKRSHYQIDTSRDPLCPLTPPLLWGTAAASRSLWNISPRFVRDFLCVTCQPQSAELWSAIKLQNMKSN